jgi:6-phosphogluconolactonase
MVGNDSREVSERAADLFVAAAAAAVRARNRFTVALSGGATPRPLYELLATPPYSERIAWPQVYLFWGDERCVPPDHPDSGYGMVREAMLSRVPIPGENVLPMYSGRDTPQEAAAKYEETLRRIFRPAPGELPRFDLVLLGLGADGHTASLFPGSPALGERKKLVVADYVEKLAAYRLTLTLRVINAAAKVIFLVTGKNKAAMLYGVLHGPYRPRDIPAQLVQPAGELIFLTDRDTAANRQVGQRD